MQAALELTNGNRINSCTLSQRDSSVSSALEAMLRVAAAEYPGILWQASSLDAHGRHQPSHQVLKPADEGEPHGSFGRQLTAGVCMPAMLRPSSQALSGLEVRPGHALCFLLESVTMLLFELATLILRIVFCLLEFCYAI